MVRSLLPFYTSQAPANVSKGYKHFAIPAIKAGFPVNVPQILSLLTTLSAGPLSHYLHEFPELNSPEKIAAIIAAGHETYKGCFPILYLISIAFGGAAIVASLFLKDLDRYINEDVAVML